MAIIVILSTLMVNVLVIYLISVSNASGTSSFVNQQYVDQTSDWELLTSRTGTFSILAPDGNVTKLPSEDQREKCLIDEYPDIRGVSYKSDGEIIYATLWVDPIVIDQNTTFGTQNKWVSGGYQMPIDIPSVYDYGTDYVYRLEWKPQNQTWSNTLEERNIGIGGKNKIYGPLGDAEEFMGTDGNHVIFLINRSMLSLPERFKIIFSTWGAFQNDEHHWCVLTDATSFIDIPPPVFNLSVSEIPSYIRKGETVIVPIRISSDSASNSLAQLKAVNNSNSIALNIIPEDGKVNIPPYSQGDSLLEIKALDSRYPAQVIVNASISFPSSPKLPSGAVILTPSINNISDEVRFSIGILPELGLYDYVKNTLDTWGTAASEAIAIVAGLGGAVTAIALIVSKFRGEGGQKDKRE
jgi:hypothetical protein